MSCMLHKWKLGVYFCKFRIIRVLVGEVTIGLTDITILCIYYN